MKKLITSVKKWEDRLEAWWQELPDNKQRKIIWFSLLIYILITAAVIAEAWLQDKRSDSGLEIRHIYTPTIPLRPQQP